MPTGDFGKSFSSCPGLCLMVSPQNDPWSNKNIDDLSNYIYFIDVQI
jgi:hypothetical protein